MELSELFSVGMVAGIVVVGCASFLFKPWWHQWCGGLSDLLDRCARHWALMPAAILVGLVGFGLYARDRQSLPITTDTSLDTVASVHHG